jgi:hypothetical protein
MSEDLVVITAAAPPVLAVSAKAMNLDELEKMLDEEAQRGGFFVGDVLTFRKGKWQWGFGKDAQRWDEREASLILNIPNMWFGWRTFDDGKPIYGPIANPLLGQRLVDRKALGKTDKDQWDQANDGKPMDPWSRYAAVPFRFDGDDKDVNCLVINNWSGVQEVKDFLRLFAKEARKHFGKLPVVNLGSAERTHWDDDSITFDVPTFDLIDWEDPVEADTGGAFPTDDGAEIPQASVSVVQRTESPHPVDELKRTANNAAAVERIAEQAGAKTSNTPTDSDDGGFGEVVKEIEAKEEAANASRRRAAKSEPEAKPGNMWGGKSAGRRQK